MRSSFSLSFKILPLTDYIPQKQGLRLVVYRWDVVTHDKLTDYIPQKQGLRQEFSHLFQHYVSILTDYIPQKQGLRQKDSTCTNNNFYNSQTIFHKNKD